jgi:hypothetical protein
MDAVVVRIIEQVNTQRTIWLFELVVSFELTLLGDEEPEE